MPTFSQRTGLIPLQPIVQLDGMSSTLRTSLWNVLVERVSQYQGLQWKELSRLLCSSFFKEAVDELPEHGFQRQEWVKERFFGISWHRVYDLIEFIAQVGYATFSREAAPVIVHFNQILEREASGYRFIGDILAPIANPEELAAISEASGSSHAALRGASEHLRTSVALLGKRPDPDYRNSIKEAVSAVESAVKVVTGETGGGLKDALAAFADLAPIHGSLKAAMLSLYGYTSDESGIRHAILDDPTVGFNEAKFMLVSCSAFVNFLIGKAEQVGIAH